jgi:hypothetical protein
MLLLLLSSSLKWWWWRLWNQEQRDTVQFLIAFQTVLETGADSAALGASDMGESSAALEHKTFSVVVPRQSVG